VKRITIALLVIGILVTPYTVSAFSFGGKIVSPPVVCDTGVLFFIKGFPYTGPIMWTPGTTKPNLVNMSVPPVFGQCVLGRLAPTFHICTVAGAPVGGGFTIAPIPGYGSSVPGCFF